MSIALPPQARTFPVYQSASGWNAMLPPRNVRTSPPAGTHFRYVVIGAGFTGLAAARRLAELNPDDEVLVLDSDVVGEGSAGRNSGFVINVPHNVRAGMSADSVDAARKQMRIYDAGLEGLHQLVQGASIDCGWDVAGKYHAAATPEGERRLKTSLDNYRAWGVEYQVLDRSALADRLGTDYYHFGYHSMNNVFVQPAALIRGLADTLPANVWLMERNPVHELSDARPFKVTARHGVYTADNVVLANNAFAKALGFLQSRLITIYTYAGITPVLAPHELATLGSRDQWGVIPAHRLGTTLRRIRGGRFMVRSAYSYEREQPLDRVRARLQDSYRRRFPQLSSHAFEFVWGGTTALTRNGASFFGEVSPGLYAAVGCNGAGVLKGCIHGKLLADLIAGQRSALLDDVQSLEAPNWIPPEPFRWMGVVGAIRYQAHRAGLER